MIKTVFKYAEKKFILSLLALILIQQIFNAGATALLAMSGKSLFTPDRFILFLIAFFVVSQMPYLIAIFIRKTEMRGYAQMYFNFLNERLFSHSARPKVWSHKSQKETYMTAIGPEADTFISAVAYCHFDIFLYVTNILFNAFALSFVIDADFIVVFAVSALLSSIFYLARHKALDSLVQEEQQSRLNFSAYVLKAWDNVFLKNPIIFERYRTNLEDQFKTVKKLTGNSFFRSYSMVFWLSVISCLPVFGFSLYLATQSTSDPSLLTALLATLPRQIQVLGVFNALFQQITNLKVFTARFKTALENSKLKEAPIEELTDYSKIKLNGSEVQNFEEVLSQVQTQSFGRHQISGFNGSGKSSLLLRLHSYLENSLYVPPAPDFEIGDAPKNESTGQKMLKYLNFVAKTDVPILLLDEWDANLDVHRKKEISQTLDQLAKNRLILEVRHLTAY